MRILLVNVNTTDSVTEVIAGQARSVAAPGTEIVPLTPFFGPESVEGNFESYLSAVAVMDRVISFDGPYDAVVQAGFGEHGREGLQELCDVPVIDITEAAAHLACLIGRRYSVVTSLDRTVPQIQDRLTLARLDGRCASVRSSGLGVLDIERDRAAATAAIAAQARAAVEEDGAEVVCLGCAGMAGLDEAVRAATDVPVVDGVTAAVPLAESLVRLGLTTSKIRTYARPRPKAVTGWPLHAVAVPTTSTATAAPAAVSPSAATASPPATTAPATTAPATTPPSAAATATAAPSAPPPRQGAALDLP